MKLASCALLLVAAFSSSFAFASDKKPPDPALRADTAQAFADQSAAIRKEMETGGRFEFVKPADRTVVERRLDEIAALMSKAQTVKDLNDKDTTALINAQEEANAILTRNDGDRLICERRTVSGSHMMTTDCKTYAERERQRRIDQKAMMDNTMRPRQCGGDSLSACKDKQRGISVGPSRGGH